jgi:hypothetical protein
LGDLVARVPIAQTEEAPLANGMEVAGEQELVLAGDEESAVLGVARIVHQRQSLPGHGSILRLASA